MARRRGDQPVDQTRGLDLVAPAERLDDALHVAATLAGVLDEVEILVGSDLLDADEHGAAPCSWQSTTILCVTTSKIATLYCNRPDGLAPHHGATCRTPNNSADLSNHFPQNRGSWVKAGLSRARAQGKRLGRRPVCAEVVERIRESLATGAGILKTAKALGVGTGTVHKVRRSMAAVAV